MSMLTLLHAPMSESRVSYAVIVAIPCRGPARSGRNCYALTRRFADGLVAIRGVEVLNSVELNQVLLRFRTDEDTQRILEHVQQSGVAWMGATSWEGRPAIRISVSSWVTNETDVDHTV